MTYKLAFNEDEQIIEIEVEKDFDWSVMEKLVPDVSQWIVEKKCNRILVDVRNAQLKLSTLKIYMTPEMLTREFAKYSVDVRLVKRALLVQKDYDNFRFFETVTLNQSQKMRLFSNEPSARAWLRE